MLDLKRITNLIKSGVPGVLGVPEEEKGEKSIRLEGSLRNTKRKTKVFQGVPEKSENTGNTLEKLDVFQKKGMYLAEIKQKNIGGTPGTPGTRINKRSAEVENLPGVYAVELANGKKLTVIDSVRDGEELVRAEIRWRFESYGIRSIKKRKI